VRILLTGLARIIELMSSSDFEVVVAACGVVMNLLTYDAARSFLRSVFPTASLVQVRAAQSLRFMNFRSIYMRKSICFTFYSAEPFAAWRRQLGGRERYLQNFVQLLELLARQC
jgi:hypothetical protein